jgi:O-antigen ligase
MVTTSLGRRPDLTDRTTTWTEAMALKTNPIIGVGFASFWTTPDGMRLGAKLQVASAHNGYLETYLNTGLIGIALLIAVMFAAGKNAKIELLSGASIGPLFGALLIIGLIYNLSETAFNNTGIIGFVLWLIAVRYPFPNPAPTQMERQSAAFQSA